MSARAPEGANASVEESKQQPVEGNDLASAEGELTLRGKSRDSTGTQRAHTSQSVRQEEEYEPTEADIFDEFLAQVSFKRTTEIDGYSSTKIQFTFIPMKLNDVSQRFTLFMQNQDYTKPIPIEVQGTCVDVPIYVEKEEYNLNVLVYE